MLYREIIAVCSQIHTKHINTLCGQNGELLNVKLAVHMVTTVLQPPEMQLWAVPVVQPLLHFLRNQHFHIGRSCSQPIQHARRPSANASEQPHTQKCLQPRHAEHGQGFSSRQFLL